MILLIIFFLLSIGAVITFLVPPQQRAAHILVSLIPVAAVAALLLRLPLPDAFSISWFPSALFPDPLKFRADTSSIAFAIYLCCLLILIEWTRPLRLSPGRSSRVVIYMLTISGIVACFASNPLAVIVIWSLIDFLFFLSILFLESPVEIGLTGISSSLSHSMGVLAINMLGNILVLFSLFIGSSGSPLDWSILWSASPFNFSPNLFLAGILLRLLIAPMQFTFSRIQTTSTGTEILLRIVSPAAALCLLSKIWPSQPPLSGSGWGFSWLIIPLSVLLLAAGWQWCFSASAFGRRNIFFLILPSFAVLSAIVYPQTDSVFLAAGGMLILGGGILLMYIGYLSHRRWMAGFPIFLGILFAGIPFSPMTVWSDSLYPGLLSPSGILALIPLAVCHIFILCAIFRLAFETVEEFPSNEPLFLFTFAMGMVVCLLALFFPGWKGIDSLSSVAAPVLLLAGGIFLFFLVRRFQRTGTALFLLLERIFRLEWLQRALVFSFQKTAILVSAVESFLSGEGAMLWSLGIALLLYLVFRGG
jgi:hypothetical protein